MIRSKLSFEDFQKFNYILYDQYLFRNLLEIYESEKIKYKLLAINIFKEKKITPIVVKIDTMSSALLRDYYENIYLLENTEYINKFDEMSLVQNLIKTDLDLDSLAENLTKLMLINKKIFFRFYDPRILIHIYMLKNYDLLNIELKKWIESYSLIFERWSFDLMGHSFEMDSFDFKMKKSQVQMNTYLENFDQINKKIREFCRKNNDFKSLIDFMEKQYLVLEVKNVK